MFVHTGLHPTQRIACYRGQTLLMHSCPLMRPASVADPALRHKVWQHPPRSRRGCQDRRCAAQVLFEKGKQGLQRSPGHKQKC